MYFIVTVDTEGDNLWNWNDGKPITTENTLYIPRFQNLCEEYGFVPVYLTNYEMALDERWVSYAKRKAMEGKCEIGMHLHAWNTPPEYILERKYKGNPYITEYPEDVIEQKVVALHDLLENQFEMPIVTHRAGRWVTNTTYFNILVKHGIKIDCSVTPGLDLSGIPGCSKNCGNDYRKMPHKAYEIVPGLLEVPMSTATVHHVGEGTLKHKAKTIFKGDALWLRPIKPWSDMIDLTDYLEKKQNICYLELMIHSSELMPGGSPYGPNESSVEKMYERMKRFFEYVTEKGYQGISLERFATSIKVT